MAAIIAERTLAASPARVFRALTQPGEIARWWAEQATLEPEVGSVGTFRFRPPAGDLQFEVTELLPNKHVHWVSRQGPPEWAGTSVTWQLEPLPTGTRLLFTHDGFAKKDEAFEQTRGNWDYFLDSLKSYLETGKGTPGLPRFV